MKSPNEVAATLILAYSEVFAHKNSGKFRFDHTQLKKIVGKEHVGRKFIKRVSSACREEGFILTEIEPPNYALTSVEPMINYRKLTAKILNKLTDTDLEEPQNQPNTNVALEKENDDPNLRQLLNEDDYHYDPKKLGQRVL